MSIVQQSPVSAEFTPTKAQQHPLDMRVALCGMLFVCGLYVDGWAHFHGRVDESFFTPYHAVLYGSFALTSIVILQYIATRWRETRSLRASIPAFYMLSLIGVVLFATGGLADLAWHTVFGIEDGVEALISPSHLVLAVGGVLITIAPIRAAWFRPNTTLTLTNSLPITLTATAFLSLLTFFTAYIHPMTETVASTPFRRAMRMTESHTQQIGMGSFIVQSALLMGIILLINKRWRWSLPFGSLTLMLGVNALLMSVLRDNYGLAFGYIAAGLLGDLLIKLSKPASRTASVRLIAFAVPFAAALFYLLLLMQRDRFGWSVPMWTGASVISGIVGYLMSLLIMPPAPQTTITSA